MVLVAVQLSAVGSYRPPVFKLLLPLNPAQTITSRSTSSQTDLCWSRAPGALLVLVAVQLSVPGLYLPPVLKKPLLSLPPQTIITLSKSSHTAV